MKKTVLVSAILLFLVHVSIAQKYITRTGKVTFDATTSSSPEKIVGVNNEAAVIFDATNGRLIFQLLVKSFRLEKELMEEHFNENYMESDKYAKAYFDGTVENLKDLNLDQDGSYVATVTGKLDIHGVKKDVTQKGTVTVAGGKVTFHAKFKIHLADYNITVPSMVADKLAKDATITLDCQLDKK